MIWHRLELFNHIENSLNAFFEDVVLTWVNYCQIALYNSIKK